MRTLGWMLLIAIGAWSVEITSAHADTRVRLVPQNVSSHALNPTGHYLPGEVVFIHIYLEQTITGPDHLLRTATFHFDASSHALEMGIGAITFAPFSATGHDVDSSRTTGPAGIGVDYFFDPAHLGPNPAVQLLMPGNGTAALVASFPVTMPTAPGSYLLDVMNATGPTTNDQAAVTYGFGCAANSPCAPAGSHPDGTFPVTTDLPGAGLTGGTLNLVTNTPTVFVADYPPPAPVFTLHRVTHPLDGGSLWCSQQQVIRIAFSHDIGAFGNLPTCPGFEIRELTPGPTPATGANFAGGVLGANLNVGAAFICGIESDQGGAPRILRIFDVNPANLRHRKWYTVQNLGAWSGAPPFRMDYRFMVGDADNNGLVNATDVGWINGNGQAADVCYPLGCRGDIDGNRVLNPVDIGAANASIPTGWWLPKPAGHPR